MSELVLLIALGGRTAALRASDIHSVVELDAVISVPRSPPHILGLSALRSNTLTVIDTAAAIGLAPAGNPGKGARTPIVDHCGQRYALVLEDIDDVATTDGTPKSVPGEAGPGWQQASEGLVETSRGPALLLSLEAVLGTNTVLAA